MLFLISIISASNSDKIIVSVFIKNKTINNSESIMIYPIKEINFTNQINTTNQENRVKRIHSNFLEKITKKINKQSLINLITKLERIKLTK